MSLNKIPFLKFGGSMILAAVVVATAIGAGIAALGTGSQIPLFDPINPLNAAEYAGTATLLQSGKVLDRRRREQRDGNQCGGNL